MDGKKPLFSVRKEDLSVQYFRAGGPGGQKQNKTSSACRIVHAESGAVGESRECRQQSQNRRRAFARMTNSREFQLWVRMKAAAIVGGHRDIEEKIDKMMAPENLKVERLGNAKE